MFVYLSGLSSSRIVKSVLVDAMLIKPLPCLSTFRSERSQHT